MIDLEDDPTGIVLIAACCLIGLLLFVLPTLDTSFKTKDDILKEGEYWTKKCFILEGNMDRGFFKSAQNRLKCGDGIINVNKSDYDRAVKLLNASNN